MWFWWPPIPGKLGFKTLWFLVTSVSPSLPVIDGRVKSISSIRTLTSIWVWSGFQRICWPQIKYFEKGWKEIGPWWQNRDSWVYCALVRTTIPSITSTSNYIISIPTDDLLIGSSQLSNSIRYKMVHQRVKIFQKEIPSYDIEHWILELPGVLWPRITL